MLHLNQKSDWRKKKFRLLLHNLSFTSNISDFDLEKFSGDFNLSKDGVSIKDMTLKTTRTSLALSAELEHFNIFAPFNKAAFRDAPFKISFNADKFDFGDLETFVPEVDMLHGKIKGDIELSGQIKRFAVKKLVLQVGETKLETIGSIEKLDTPSEMLIHARFSNSRIFANDVADLLPDVTIPQIVGYEEIVVDSLSYDGTPLKFISKAKLLAVSYTHLTLPTIYSV